MASMSGHAVPAPHEDNQLIIERREKLKALRQQQADGKGVAFPNDIKPEHRAEALFAQYDSQTKEELEPLAIKVHVAGRMMLKRVMGKASFATLQDASFGPSGGRIQVYINNEGVGEAVHPPISSILPVTRFNSAAPVRMASSIQRRLARF